MGHRCRSLRLTEGADEPARAGVRGGLGAAWARVTPRTFYFDWPATRKAQRNLDAAFTPAVSLLRGLDVALGMLLEAGLDEAFEKHVRLGRAARAGVKAMGLELFSPDDDSSAVVTR